MSEVKRVLVAMSGGVDSSVAAALLREAGHDLVGVTLHLWDADGEQQVGRCCAPETETTRGAPASTWESPTTSSTNARRFASTSSNPSSPNIRPAGLRFRA